MSTPLKAMNLGFEKFAQIFIFWRTNTKTIMLICSGAQTGVIFNANTVLESEKWKENQAEKYFHLTSNGWYFKGDNELEICGGPILKSGSDIYRVNSHHHCDNLDLTLQQLKIVRKEKREKKQNSLTPKPPRKAWRSRSQSLG